MDVDEILAVVNDVKREFDAKRSHRWTSESSSPWITVGEAATRARCGVKLIYREVRAGRLQAVRVGGRRELRLRAEWIDTWLLNRPQHDG
jgi:excisionase family DNA binding protein